MADLLDLEMAATMPWTVAQDGSLWIATGDYRRNGQLTGTFVDCLARCLPSSTHGTDARVFEVLVYGDPRVVSAADITRAKELILVYADDPLTALYLDDQDAIDHALRARGLS